MADCSKPEKKKKAGPIPQEQVVLEPPERLKAVIRLIRMAQRRLLISMFRCKEKAVLEELAAALRRKVQVHALVTPRAKGGKLRLNELGALLEGMGAKVMRYPDQVVKYHAKYMVVDDGPGMVASLNFTKKCFRRTSDFLQITYDPAVVSGLIRLFESDCSRVQTLLPPDLSERLIVGPDRARVQITDFLQSARRRIRILDPKVTDADVLMLLEAKRADGVEVQINQKRELGSLTSHGKLILVDDSAALFGSISLCTLSLDFRRELAIKVQDPYCVEQLVGYFDFLANGGPPAPEGPAQEVEPQDSRKKTIRKDVGKKKEKRS